MATWTDEYYFITGAARNANELAFVLSNQEDDKALEPQSRIVTWTSGIWGLDLKLEWNAVGICPLSSEEGSWVVVGEQGQVRVITPSGIAIESVGTGADSPEKIGNLATVRAIGGIPYAVGPRRQAYRRTGTGKWERVDQGARLGYVEFKPENYADFFAAFDSIDGFSEDEIYSVGPEGAVWCRSKGKWRHIPMETNIALNNLCCAADGQVYVCGLAGMLLRGRRDEWEQIATESGVSDDLWGIAWFQNRLYVSSMTGLFSLIDDDLIPVEFDTVEPNTCYHLIVAGETLWSIGTNDVLVFDGNSWTRIE